MLQKTEMSEASTNAQQKTTSFFTTTNRQMFLQLKKNESSPQKNPLKQISSNLLPNDLLLLNPQMVSSLAWPQVFVFENDLNATVKGNFYHIQGLRNNNKFIRRRSQPGAELIFFFAEKPTRKINLVTIQRFLKHEGQQQRLWLHMNISKYETETGSAEWADFYLQCQRATEKNHEVWDFCSFQSIQNFRKGVFVFRIYSYPQSNQFSYRFVLADLQQHPSKYNPAQQKALHVLTSVNLDCELNYEGQNENFLKTVKSQFGDVILMVTSRQIYEVQVEQLGEGYKMDLKIYKVSKFISNSRSNYLKSENQMGREDLQKGVSSKEERIIDAHFMSNGLKIMILTNYQQIVVIEAHNFLFGQSVLEAFADAQVKSKYDLNSLVFTRLYPINGSIALEFNSKNDVNLLKDSNSSGNENTEQFLTKGIVLLKVQNNSLYFMKLINLQIQHRDTQYLSIHSQGESDQILLQYIQKKNPCILNLVKCKILMNELNSMVKMDELQYGYPKMVNAKLQTNLIPLNHKHFLEVQKKYIYAEMAQSSRVVFLLQDKQLTCYKLFSEIDRQVINKPFHKLFNHSFFEKPLKMAVSPLTLHFAIIFKQFVKFFYFNYDDVKNYFTLKIKNVNDVSYVGRGQKILITCTDGMIYLVDSYSFQEEMILQIYGQPVQANLIDQKHLLVRSNKNMLAFYQRGLDESDTRSLFSKKYEVKLEDNDLYCASLQNLVVFRKDATVQVYAHHPEPIQSNLPESDRECLEKLRNQHPHLINRKKDETFKKDEVATKIVLSEQLGFLLVSTNKGNIRQMIWPLQDPTNPNPPDVFCQQVSPRKIISFFIDAKYTCLYSVSENGCIEQLQICQYIMAEKMPIVYLLNNKVKGLEQQKREFTDRNYLIDEWAPTEMGLTQIKQQSIDELNFFVDKLRDDIDEMTKSLQFKIRKQEQQLKRSNKTNEKDLKNIILADECKYKEQLHQLQSIIDANEREFQAKRNEEVEKYQRTLLGLYKESDRLKNILKTQDDTLTSEKQQFVKQFQVAISQLNEQKTAELIILENKYREIEERKNISERQNAIENREEEAEMDLYKAKLHEQQQEQYTRADEIKETYLGENTKREKEIANLKKRAIYFQNLILETKVQIAQLMRDKDEYEIKKQYLKDELRDKEDVIEKIERELVHYLKNTEDMKTIKNNHEFELGEYEQEVAPIQDNFNRIETNVKQMNVEIMKEYNLKVEKTELINEQLQMVADMKQRKRELTIRKLEEEGKFTRIAEKLVQLSDHPFNCDVRGELKGLLNKNMKSQQSLRLEQSKEREKREAERLMRYKNMIRKQIEEEQKREENIIKNQHQYYRYHNENTTLVREFNELRKTQKYLSNQQNKLEEKLNLLRASRIHTPLRRVPSINLQKIVEKKMTPYQHYEEEQQVVNSRNKGETSDTRLSRNSQSLSFLKGLMKEINHTDSKNEKLEVMRERVRTFVNPELKSKRNEDIKKILFGRSRMTSEMLKLK